MTRTVTPKLEQRTAEEIYRDLAGRMPLSPDRSGELYEALLRIFARYFEVVAERLNRAPDRNFLAFLNVLGVSRIPPTPAQVPLTFVPVKAVGGDSRPISVPARVKVAAPPGSGDSEPVVFETLRPLRLTRATLCDVASFDPVEDRYAVHHGLACSGPSASQSVFVGTKPVEHAFYIGHATIFGAKNLAQLRLRFDAVSPGSARFRQRAVEWSLATPKGPIVLQPAMDSTNHLSGSGEIVFNDLPEWPEHEILSESNRWLTCRLLDPIKSAPHGRRGCSPPLPRLARIGIVASCEIAQAPLQSALFNNLQLDTSRDFFPFGERPRFGDVFYLNCEAFSLREATVSLTIRLTNPASAGASAPIRPTHREGNPETIWETLCGGRWMRLDCRDTTRAFTEDGEVTFTVPPHAAPGTVGGQEGSWIRARLISGNYGEDERFAIPGSERPGEGPSWSPSTLAPPSIKSIEATSSIQLSAESPETVITNNNLAFEKIDFGAGKHFSPFQASDSLSKSLYFGFQASSREVLAQRKLDLYFHCGTPAGRLFSRDERDQSLPSLAWHYWSGNGWRNADVGDGTASLTQSGIVTVAFGDELSPWKESSLDPQCYWLRASWISGNYPYGISLSRVALNTVPATHCITLEHELLGSSGGIPWQTFHTARVPVVGDMELEVREPTMPSEAECVKLQREEGERPVVVTRDSGGRIEEIWVRWHEVSDFSSSSGKDRHYVLNRLTGEIRFGDGKTGRIPPKGPNGIRIRSYRTGGGAAGNKPTGSVTQLRTSIPFIASAVNLENAVGGQDIEDWPSVQKRGPRWLRHRGRAVTEEDYEDLAVASSPAVARAKCYAARDLIKDPTGRTLAPGVVSVVIVPNGGGKCPKPTAGLLLQVRQFLDRRRALDADLVAVAPEFVHISVDVELVLAKMNVAVDPAAECEKQIEAFLHPVTGGQDGDPWCFGQVPKESDFYPLLESVAGVDHVTSLALHVDEERPGLLASKMFLICAGTLNVRAD